MEFIREDCIYARQSVDRKDSISIESQIDFCKYELKGGSCRVFKDKGYGTFSIYKILFLQCEPCLFPPSAYIICQSVRTKPMP